MERFAQDPTLGVAGTPRADDVSRPDRHSFAHKGANLNHVSGACQLFRRGCWDSVGGYTPIKGGAIDWIAVTTARMKGWTTRTFTEKVCFHHREIGTAESSTLMMRFHYGKKAYYVGGHPAWEFLRGLFEMRSRAPDCRRLGFSCGLWLGRRHTDGTTSFTRTHGFPSAANK